MSDGLRSHVCVDSCPNSYVSWMYQLRTSDLQGVVSPNIPRGGASTAFYPRNQLTNPAAPRSVFACG